MFFCNNESLSVRKGFPKKSSFFLDFVQMRGGRVLPKFFVHLGVEVIWIKSKRTPIFIRETLPTYVLLFHYIFVLFLPKRQ